MFKISDALMQSVFKMATSLFVFQSLTFLLGCSSKPIDLRVPASTSVYNVDKIRLLKKAADAGILFQISDAALRDVPSKQVTERCRKVDEAMWSEKLFETLQTVTGSNGFSNKMHVIEFKRGDAPKVEITKDLLDGVTYLQISYGKIETREKLKKVEKLPCSDKPLDLMDQELVTVEFNWPTKEQVYDVLAKASDRPDSDRFKFDNSFLMYLAERQTIFRLNPDIAFERSAAGHNLLRAFMAKMSSDAKVKGGYQNLDFWLHELSLKSKQASNIKFFSLKKDSSLAHGIQVDSGGKFARKIGGFSDPSYLYVSYKSENGAFFLPSLKDLDQCLAQLSSIAGSAEYKNNFDMDADSFLYPGHHCQLSESAVASREPASDPKAAPIVMTPAPELPTNSNAAASTESPAPSDNKLAGEDKPHVDEKIPASVQESTPPAVAAPDTPIQAPAGAPANASVSSPETSIKPTESAQNSATSPTVPDSADKSEKIETNQSKMPASVPASQDAVVPPSAGVASPVEDKVTPPIEKLQLPPIIDVMDPTQTRPN